MLHSRQGSGGVVALITKPLSSSTAAETVREARHLALPIIGLAAAIAILYFGRVFFITSLLAMIIAFILEPFVVLLMRIRFPRSLASFVVCTIALLFLYVIGMGAYSQLSAIYGDLPKYGERIGDIIDNVRQTVQGAGERTLQMVVPAREGQQQQEADRPRAQQLPTRRSKRVEPTPPPPAPTGAAAIPEVRIHDD